MIFLEKIRNEIIFKYKMKKKNTKNQTKLHLQIRSV